VAVLSGSPADAERAWQAARAAADEAARKALDAGALARDAASRQFTRTLHDTLAFLEDPEEVLKDPNNRVLALVREPYETWKKAKPALEREALSEEVARSVVRGAPLFRGLDDLIGSGNAEDLRQRFVRAVVELNRVVAEVRVAAAVGLSLFSLFLTIQGLLFFQRRLINLLFRKLRALLRLKFGRKVAEHALTKILLWLARRQVKKLAGGPLKRFLRKKILEAAGSDSAEAAKNVLVFLSREALYEQLGHNRVGHHSLMAKDHGRELLYAPMKD
jgi:hypothetical protein